VTQQDVADESSGDWRTRGFGGALSRILDPETVGRGPRSGRSGVDLRKLSG